MTMHAKTSSLLRVLLVEDREDDVLLLSRHLSKAGYTPEFRQLVSLQALALALREGDDWDVVISSAVLPGVLAADVMQCVQRSEREIPVIVVSAIDDEALACSLIEAGAQDYLLKNKLGRLRPVIERGRRAGRAWREALSDVYASESRLQAMAGNVPGVLFRMRRDEAGVLRFMYLSDACRKLLGVPGEEILSRPLLSMLTEEEREGFLSALLGAEEQGLAFNWEGRIFLEGEGPIWMNLRCSPRIGVDGQQIWEGLMWNITESKQTTVQLQDSRKQLSDLSAHFQRIKEEERERIARDVHDVMGGALVGIKIAVSLLGKKLGESQDLFERVRDIERMLDDAIATAGRVVQELRPGILREFGLAAAVESYAGDYEQRTGLRCEVLCADYDIEVDEDVSLALFRSCQEALANVSKHAQASRAEIRLIQDGDEIVLEVGDDGCGVHPADMQKPKSFGLRGIRERLAQLGGHMEICSVLPKGSKLVLRIPLGAGRARLDNSSQFEKTMATEGD